jgi:hypothetical protein
VIRAGPHFGSRDNNDSINLVEPLELKRKTWMCVRERMSEHDSLEMEINLLSIVICNSDLLL